MAANISQRDPKYRNAKLIIEAVPMGDNEILDIIEAHIEMAKNRG